MYAKRILKPSYDKLFSYSTNNISNTLLARMQKCFAYRNNLPFLFFRNNPFKDVNAIFEIHQENLIPGIPEQLH